MELTGPQFTGKHAAPYSGNTDLQKLAGTMKPKTPYVAKHAAPAQAPKPPATKTPTTAKTPTRIDNSKGGQTGKAGSATPRNMHNAYYHHQHHSATDQMTALVGFQGDQGRTVA